MTSTYQDLRGLGGWLLLVGVGVLVAPLRMLLADLPEYVGIFTDGTWQALTMAESPFYHPGWGPLLIAEVTYNAIYFLVSLYVIYLYFTMKRMFPLVFVCVLGAPLIVIPLESFLVRLILPNQPVFDPDSLKQLSQTVLVVAIWVPYMYVSKRVKATFTEPSWRLHTT